MDCVAHSLHRRRPLGSFLDLDDDEGALRRPLTVLRVFRAQKLERAIVALDNAGPAAQPHPPELCPVVVVVVDDDLDARVALDVGEARKLTRVLRLLVDGGVERVALVQRSRSERRAATRPAAMVASRATRALSGCCKPGPDEDLRASHPARVHRRIDRLGERRSAERSRHALGVRVAV